MNLDNIRIIEISQNSWEEENFTLLTTLTDEQISQVLQPLIDEEREEPDGNVLYDNETLTQKLCEVYPDEMTHMYQTIEILEL